MQNNKITSVESFLLWMKERTGKELYIIVRVGGSGEICEEGTDKKLFEFESSRQLYDILNKITNV